MAATLDPSFLELPARALADAALQRARDLGAEHAAFRLERRLSSVLTVHDTRPEPTVDRDRLGIGVRVLVAGTWGYAGTADVSLAAAVRAAEDAVALAVATRALARRKVELADEPVHRDVWVSAYDVDPFTVPDVEKGALLAERSAAVLAHDGVAHVTAVLQQALECTFYADTSGSEITQQRVRVSPELTASGVDEASGTFDTMASVVPPAARGWEYVTGADGVVDWEAEVAALGPNLAERLRAPAVEPGLRDVVIDPTNLWLTVHETVGHATELDRVLGHEANTAGTSFATTDQLGTLRYGSTAMHVVADRTTTHGLATVGYDDEGVAAQSWDLVRDGVLVGYQTNRALARMNAGVLGTARSNGCAYADSPAHGPIQRMPNVSLLPDPNGPGTDELLGRVDDGLYVLGVRSWSIDSQRHNFQFVPQRAYRLRDGELNGQVRDVAYQGVTQEFWGSLEAVGGPETYRLGGSFMCGKGEPMQLAPVSHGAPAALFRRVNILSTAEETP